MKNKSLFTLRHDTRAAAAGFLLASAALPASAASIYWDGTSPSLGSWDDVANWSTDSGATTPNPADKPGASDDAVFNISTENANQTLTLNANNQAANSLTFSSAGNTTIVRSAGATSTVFRTITLGAGGLTVNSGAGNVSIGTGAGTGSQFVNIGLIGNNFFKNDSTGTLTIGRQVTTANALGAITLTVNGAGSGLTDFQREIFQGATASDAATSGTTLSVAISTAADHTTLFRNAGSTYSGGLVINSGLVGARTSNGFGAGTITINGGAIGATGSSRTFNNDLVIGGNIQFGGINNTAGGGSSGATWNGNVDLGNATRTITLGGSTQTFAGEISNGGLTVSASGGARTVVLSGTSTYSGGTTINTNATLRLGHATNTLRDDGAININGGTLNVDNPDTVGAVTLTSGTISGDSALTGASYDMRSGTVSTELAGSGVALTKTTGGTVTLSGTHTYTGATLVSAGTLLVNGSLGNTAVTVESGGTIGGSGSLGGSLGLDAGAKLDLTGATLGEVSTGILTAGGTSSITLTDFAFASITGWDWASAANGTYTLINGGGSVILAGTTPTEANPFNFGAGRQGYFQSGSLQAVIIPEPSAALLGSLGLLALLRRRRAIRRMD